MGNILIWNDTSKRCVDWRQFLKIKALSLWRFALSQRKLSIYLTKMPKNSFYYSLFLWKFGLPLYRIFTYLIKVPRKLLLLLPYLLPGNKMINFIATVSFATLHIDYLMDLFYFEFFLLSSLWVYNKKKTLVT